MTQPRDRLKEAKRLNNCVRKTIRDLQASAHPAYLLELEALDVINKDLAEQCQQQQALWQIMTDINKYPRQTVRRSWVKYRRQGVRVPVSTLITGSILLLAIGFILGLCFRHLSS